ncbi:DUF262 domain-containing protein [Achromobacter sp.]|uniref:DUF262 domain-containing protein n=1 Tax=Achromobacter sp. TaxID=134375 RepID=UPI002896A926|nr:DUF262 domain-containing protein [Achromobacter sp.]
MTSVTKTVFKVGDFISWAQNGQLDLSPRFQRRPVWRTGAKSYLIDSIVRGLPIPIVFLRDRVSLQTLASVREVVDGQQRLRTILSFVSPRLVAGYQKSEEFRVSKTHNARIANRSFDELSTDDRRAILEYEIPVHIFSSDTDDREILQIFARLNATGVRLNDQELRNAEYFGVFKTTAYNLAYENLHRWQNWGVVSDSDVARMVEVEEVSDLLISMDIGVHAKNKRIIDSYYETYDDEYPYEDQASRRFEVVMNAIEDQLGDDLKDLEFRRRSLFSDLFVAIYHMMFGLNTSLTTPKKPSRLPSNFAKIVKSLSASLETNEIDEDVSRSLRGATAHFGTRLTRVNFILEPFGYELTESE